MIADADRKGRPAVYSWEDINKFMTNMNIPQFDYSTFKQSYDSWPDDVKKIIQNFDENGVELKSKKSAPEKSQDQTGNSVSQMAKRATKAAMNK